ncbi:haloalkane dehalogenase [Eilatimonas milleporae]|uniref:Haloalkane dehalogenase n=1 Tax=Eilatimonas milleporae TaxID=911205 RepID=A0A3M0CVD0_9PROT|nr:haloalkane dehalogenase [Eilatimonas milleporae]RMB13044.1 haloalkane dehalogenase [Eilatimonas milleporae]
MPETPFSTEELPQRTVNVLGRTMAYVDLPAQDSANRRTLVFQHGNPTSSYLWRNIMPHLTHHGRCVAVDLIGMGASDKITPSGAGTYDYFTQREHLYAAWDAIDLGDDIVFVVHDWGSALGFDWISRNAERVSAFAYMEGIVCPVRDWDAWPEAARGIFQGFRSDMGEEMILEKNLFIERVLPGSILRPLSDTEMEIYRRPFLEPGESRRPTLDWPRQIPIGHEPAGVAAEVERYSRFLAESDLPKLFINADPGAILIGAQRDFCRTWKNQREVTVSGSHFIQEDSPVEITAALNAWLAEL